MHTGQVGASQLDNTIIIKKDKNALIKRFRRDKYLLLMLIPVVAYYIIFHYIPLYGIGIAFQDYNMFKGFFGSEWVGFDNFKRIFSTSDFFLVLRNTIGLNLLSLVVGFPGPIILALLLNELRSMKYKRSIQTIVYLPHFISWVVIANMVIPLLSPTGVLNKFIEVLGHEPIYFMGNKGWLVVVYILVGMWKEVGWGAIIYLSALAAIDQEQYEAAVIDGAGKWKQCIHITLPGITPTIAVLLILRMGGIMSIGFDAPFLLGNGMVSEVSDVISTYVYRIGLLSADISRSTTIGVFQSIVNLIILLTANYFSKKITDEGIY